jgi:hypothetical protein
VSLVANKTGLQRQNHNLYKLAEQAFERENSWKPAINTKISRLFPQPV